MEKGIPLGAIPLNLPPQASQLLDWIQEGRLLSQVLNTDFGPSIKALTHGGAIQNMIPELLSELDAEQKEVLQEIARVSAAGKGLGLNLLDTPTPPIIFRATTLPTLVEIYTLSEEEIEQQKIPQLGIYSEAFLSLIGEVIATNSFDISKVIGLMEADRVKPKRLGQLIKILLPLLRLSYPQLRSLVSKLITSLMPLIRLLIPKGGKP
jgi:hypothetical protein